jgi:hypothetical protein
MITLLYRILTFKFTQEDILQFKTKHLIVGIIGTWIVGMGRYWDNPKAKLLQHLGFGSVIYIFVLAIFIYLIVYPFKLKNWTYFRILTFISLTSFPAILYAIPVEKFMALGTAQTINVWFLAIVATWRMMLLYYYLVKIDVLTPFQARIMLLLPICLIINALAILNLEHVVFNIMGGNSTTGNETAYLVVIILSALSWIFILPLLILYFSEMYKRNQLLKDPNKVFNY